MVWPTASTKEQSQIYTEAIYFVTTLFIELVGKRTCGQITITTKSQLVFDAICHLTKSKRCKTTVYSKEYSSLSPEIKNSSV